MTKLCRNCHEAFPKNLRGDFPQYRQEVSQDTDGRNGTLRQRHVGDRTAIFFCQRHIECTVVLVYAETIDRGELDRVQTLAANAA